MIEAQFCEHCKRHLPEGCGHVYGHHAECLLGPRRDPEWVVGKAVWDDLTDREGLKHELNACETNIKVEIIEAIGHLAIMAYKAWVKENS